MPSKSDSAEGRKSFANATLKGMSNAKGPAVGMPSKAESPVGSNLFGKAPLKGVAKKKGPLDGKDFMNKETIKGPFGKSLSEKTSDTKKGSAAVFGGEKKSSFGGGGMPSKAQAPGSSFGKAPLKGPAGKGSTFGGGGGGMPSKAQAPGSSFGKAPLKGPAGKGSTFGGGGGGMPSKAQAPGSSFGKAPLKGPAGKGSTFGGGGMPPKAQAPGSSFDKAPLKGSFGGGGMQPNNGPDPASVGKAPLKGASSGGPASTFGKASSAPLFPNKGGIVAESESSFVARDILLDAELGRGSPEIRSDDLPPTSMPPPPKSTSNRRPVFGLGGAFGKSAPRQSAGSMPPKGSMPSQGFSSVSPPNTNMPTMKQPMQPPPRAERSAPGAPFDSEMNQPPPQSNKESRSRSSAGSNVKPSGGQGARMSPSSRQPMSDNFTPSTNMSTNQFADGRPSRSQQQTQPPANASPTRQSFSQPPPQSASGFQQGPADWKNQASPSPIGQFSNSVRDPQRAGGTRLGSLASSRQAQSPPGTARPTATGPFDTNDQQYSGGPAGPGDYQEVTVTDPRTGDRRTIRIPNPNQSGNN